MSTGKPLLPGGISYFVLFSKVRPGNRISDSVGFPASAENEFRRLEPVRRVHECVFGVLALESEPVDPRL
jgi:hypothetical protein